MPRWLRTPILLALALAAAAQLPHPPAMSYEEENPPNLVRLEVKRIEGQARDQIGMAIPNVRLGLYTETAPHQLLGLDLSDENGKFDFSKSVPDGNYRLVAIYPGLCTANIPIAVNHRARSRPIALRMEFPGLDVCSYATLR